MIDRSLIRRYVAAVHQLAESAGLVEQVRAELVAIQFAVTTDRRVPHLLAHPGITLEQKRDLLLKLAGDAPSAIYAGLVDVLLSKERTSVLSGAADMFTELCDEAAGLVRARVEVAVEPDEAQTKRLSDALSLLVGASVIVDYEVNPEIIGGARVQVAGSLIDGTLAGRLQRLVEHVNTAPTS